MATVPFWYEPLGRVSDPLLFILNSQCQAPLALSIGSPMPSSDIASFSMSTLDRVFGSPSVGGFTSPIPAPLLVRNVIHDSHRCPSRLGVEYPPGLFCRREENLKRQAETGPTPGILQAGGRAAVRVRGRLGIPERIFGLCDGRKRQKGSTQTC